jgi:hypothetical protein
MPVPVVPLPRNLTTADLAQIQSDAIAKFLAAPAGTDRDGKTVTVKQALSRSVWTYDQIREGGSTEGRLDKLEAAAKADDAGDAATTARVGRIEDALDQPILDRPAP